MEKPSKSIQDLEVKESPEVEAAEETSNEPKEPENPDDQAQGQAAGVETETKNETSVGLSGSPSCESGEILEPQVELSEESIQIEPEDLSAAAGMKQKAGEGECQKADVAASEEHSDDSIQIEQEDLTTTTGMKRRAVSSECETADAAAASDESQQSWEEVNFSFRIEQVVEEVMKITPTDHAETPQQVERSEDNSERIQEQQNVPEAMRNLDEGRIPEPVEQPHQQLQVQQVGQVAELVLEEAVVCDARQPVEEAEDIEEPQKYAIL